jgi:hypothetical protein
MQTYHDPTYNMQSLFFNVIRIAMVFSAIVGFGRSYWIIASCLLDIFAIAKCVETKMGLADSIEKLFLIILGVVMFVECYYYGRTSSKNTEVDD